MTDECIKLHLYPVQQLSVRLIKVLSTWYEMLRVDFYFYQIIPTVIKNILGPWFCLRLQSAPGQSAPVSSEQSTAVYTGIGVLTGQSQYFVTS